MKSERRSDYRTAQTLERGLDVVELICEGGPIGVSELSRRLGLSKTVAHRLVCTLEHRGYLTQDPATGKYAATWRVFTLGESLRQKTGLYTCAQPVLERLAAATGETANIGVLDGVSMVYIQKVESMEAVRFGLPVGNRAPAFCTGLGKAILAFLPDYQLQNLISRVDFRQRTSNTLRTRQELEHELLKTRKRGFSIDNEEYTRGVRCVGAPIVREDKHPIAAMSVSGPTFRLSHRKLAEAGLLVRNAAGDVSKALR